MNRTLKGVNFRMRATVYCSKCGTFEEFGFSEQKRDAIDAARKAGWSIGERTGRVLCPDCRGRVFSK
jgi:uncharacterized Zn finger protein (UPF0148 family)